MFDRLSHSIGDFFATHDAHDDFLSSSTDLADLERRMRQIETEDHDYGMHFCGAIGRHHDAP